MKSKMKIINYVIVVLSALIVICIVIFGDGLQNLIDVFVNARLRWLFIGMAVMGLYWLTEAYVLHIASKQIYKKQRFWDTIKTTLIGQYYNCITPSASGGQPMQAYHMYSCGMPIGSASSALLVRFIVYQCVLTLYSIIVLFFKYEYFVSKISGFTVFIIIGFSVNALVVIFLLGIAVAPSIVLRFFRFFAKLLAKIRIIKDIDAVTITVEHEVDKFYSSLKLLKCNVWIFFKMGIISLVQLTLFFIVPFFVLLALGLQATFNPLEVISASACVLMISSFVPLPGAAGGAEGSFLILFSPFFPDGESNKIATAILLWRFLTFYLPIIVGMIFTHDITRTRKKIDEKREQSGIENN